MHGGVTKHNQDQAEINPSNNRMAALSGWIIELEWIDHDSISYSVFSINYP